MVLSWPSTAALTTSSTLCACSSTKGHLNVHAHNICWCSSGCSAHSSENVEVDRYMLQESMGLWQASGGRCSSPQKLAPVLMPDPTSSTQHGLATGAARLSAVANQSNPVATTSISRRPISYICPYMQSVEGEGVAGVLAGSQLHAVARDGDALLAAFVATERAEPGYDPAHSEQAQDQCACQRNKLRGKLSSRQSCLSCLGLV